jgi:hypothetical protein
MASAALDSTPDVRRAPGAAEFVAALVLLGGWSLVVERDEELEVEPSGGLELSESDVCGAG